MKTGTGLAVIDLNISSHLYNFIDYFKTFMQYKIHQSGTLKLTELISDKVEIQDVQSALDVMANAGYQGAEKLLIKKENIIEAFFDLKTGLAGEILQKFSNYNMQLAIIGDFSGYSSKSLRDFIYESNKKGQILFIKSIEEAIAYWDKKY